MTRTARAAIAALTALAAVAAIIAADLTPPASAQSDDETAGRIVARLLNDGRVEFGWQPTGGARVLPRQRYFPADITHNRWLRSSPVEVDGAEIGRINARQLSDGRIEFAFTPTDGERIAPQARYFSAAARVGRWLRSTEIAIGPPATRYTAVSAGSGYSCAIRESGELACWGGNYSREGTGFSAPEGSYTAVSAGVNHACAIRTNGEVECWGSNFANTWDPETEESEFVETGQTDAPDGRFTAVSAAYDHTCAIRESGAIECWGANGAGQSDAPDGSYTAVSAGDTHTCAIRDTGEIDCWGSSVFGGTDAPDGRFTAVSAGTEYTWGLRESGAIEFWGAAVQTDAPDGRYTAVSAGSGYSCAIRESGEIDCWGDNGYYTWDPETEEREYVETGQIDAPDGSFTAVSAGQFHSCAIRESGEIDCWGDNEEGEATPPN